MRTFLCSTLFSFAHPVQCSSLMLLIQNLTLSDVYFSQHDQSNGDILLMQFYHKIPAHLIFISHNMINQIGHFKPWWTTNVLKILLHPLRTISGSFKKGGIIQQWKEERILNVIH